MKCLKCNADIADGSKFCTNCGEPTNNVQSNVGNGVAVNNGTKKKIIKYY